MIRYVGTLQEQVGENLPTKAEAKALSSALAKQARSGTDFDELLRKHSDTDDVLRGGDVRVWSTQDPGFSPLEVAQLARLGPGEVSAPIDSPLGYQVLQRVRVTATQLASFSTLEVPIEPDSAPYSKAREVASELIQELDADTQRWAEFAQEYCCPVNETWVKGTHPPHLEEAMNVPPGGLVPAPIHIPGAFLVVRRETPSLTLADSSLSSELPSRSGIDMTEWVESYGGARRIAGVLGTFGVRRLPTLGLSDNLVESFSSATSESLPLFYAAQNLSERTTALGQWRQRLEQALGKKDAAAMERHVTTWFEELALL